MVFPLVWSAKAALTLGAVIGGSVAIMANKEKLMEIAADALQKGADYLNEELEKHKVKMACQVDDGQFAFGSNVLTFGSEATTPETSDHESETDEEIGSEHDSDDHMTESFENIKEKEGNLVFERYRASTSTLIEKPGNGKGGSELDLDLD